MSDPTRAGLAIGMFNLSAGLTSLAYRRIRAWLSSEAIFALIFGFAGFGYILTSQATNFTETMIAMAVGGLSVGAFLPNTNMAIISRSSMQVRGRALGALTTLFFLGQFASPFYSVPLVTRFSVGHAFEFSGYALFTLGAGFAIFTLVRRVRARAF